MFCNRRSRDLLILPCLAANSEEAKVLRGPAEETSKEAGLGEDAVVKKVVGERQVVLCSETKEGEAAKIGGRGGDCWVQRRSQFHCYLREVDIWSSRFVAGPAFYSYWRSYSCSCLRFCGCVYGRGGSAIGRYQRLEGHLTAPLCLGRAQVPA